MIGAAIDYSAPIFQPIQLLCHEYQLIDSTDCLLSIILLSLSLTSILAIHRHTGY